MVTSIGVWHGSLCATGVLLLKKWSVAPVSAYAYCCWTRGVGGNKEDDIVGADKLLVLFILIEGFACLVVCFVGPHCQVGGCFPLRFPPMVLSRVAAC